MFGKKNNDLIAVDFSNNEIKIIRSKGTQGKSVIQDVFHIKLTQGSDAEILKELISYFKKNRISTEFVTCLIPSKSFLSKNVEIPSTEREEIEKIIDLQAGRFTPYSRDEIVIDFLCMETPTQHYTSVLLIIVNRTLVDRYCRIFEQLGVAVEIRVGSEALALQYQDWAKDWGWKTNTAVGGLCVGEEMSDFTIVDQSQMVFVRSLPVGRNHFQAGPELAVNELVSELNKSLTAYLDQGLSNPIRHMVVTGVEGVDQLLQSELSMKCPVLQKHECVFKIYDLVSKYQIPPKVQEKMSSFPSTSFSELIMVQKKSQECLMDLIPKEVKLKRRFRRDSREITSLGITIMTIFIVLSIFLYTKIYFKNFRMEKIQVAGEDTFQKARILEKISTKNRVVKKILKSRGKGIETFDEITEFLGETTYLSRLDYDANGRIVLGGTAESMSQVFALVNRLESSNRYLSVKTTKTKTRREGSLDVADFEIECIVPGSLIADNLETENRTQD